MRSVTYRRCVVAFLAILASRVAVAQDSSDVWVAGMRAPQYFAALVKNVDESAEWYRRAFGLHELDRSEADDGSWRIVNLSNEELSVEIIRDDRAQDVDRSRGFFKVGFRVPDVELVADRVERATEERPRVVDDAAHGVRIVQLRDPDGNLIQLSSLLE